MTNHETSRALVRALDPTNDLLERERPCWVRHQDAGGRCKGTATIKVCGIRLCAEHGEEAKIGALLEAYQDAGYYFDRLRNPYVPSDNDLVDRELAAVVSRTNAEAPPNRDHYRALRIAYPNPPAKVRSGVLAWERDEEPHAFTVADTLLESLRTVHKLMRLAHEEGQTWLGEVLELERESVAAQAAYALREAPALCEARPGE